jgi:hypothetical protein
MVLQGVLPSSSEKVKSSVTGWHGCVGDKKVGLFGPDSVPPNQLQSRIPAAKVHGSQLAAPVAFFCLFLPFYQ